MKTREREPRPAARPEEREDRPKRGVIYRAELEGRGQLVLPGMDVQQKGGA